MYTLKPPRGTQLDKTHPLNRGLIGCWLFNERTGKKAFDLSGNANHGTSTNMASPPTAVSGWNPSKFGGGLAFDGSDDYVDCGNGASLDITDAITLEAWIYPKGWGGAGYGRIVEKRGAVHFPYGMNINSVDSKFQFYIADTMHDANSNTISLNIWQHVVATYDKQNVRLYCNGVPAGVSAETGDIDVSTTSLIIGMDRLADMIRAFDGTIDQVRISNRALSAAEILQLYLNPFGMFQSPCEAWLYAAAAGGLSIPVAMHHYESLRA